MNDVVYQKTQPGTAIVAAILGGLAIVALTMLQRGSSELLLAVGILLLVLMIAFSSLTIRVSRSGVEWWLSFGLLRQRIPLTDIDDVSGRKVTLLHGLGIRTPNFRDWMYIVSGSKAVDVRRRDGRHVVLGSSDPSAVMQAIDTARTASSQGT